MFILYGREYDFELGDDNFHVDQIFLILYRELYYRHVYSRLQPDIDDRFHSYENSCELFNYLLSTSSIRVNLSRLPYHNHTIVFSRLRWTCASRASRTMAMGHHRRVHLPIPVLLRLALKSQVKNRRRAPTALGSEPSLELIQCSERAVLAHPEVKNPRAHCCAAGGQVARGDCVRLVFCTCSIVLTVS